MQNSAVVRADQIGSLLRPPAQDPAVLALQREVGIDIYGDGGRGVPARLSGRGRSPARRIDGAFRRPPQGGDREVAADRPHRRRRRGVSARARARAVQDHNAEPVLCRAHELVGLQALVADLASYLQLDEGFNAYVDETWRAKVAAEGRSVEEQLAKDIAADNRCYDAVRDRGVTLAMHLCRGSRISWIDGKGSYDWLAERLLDQLHVDRFLLEYDTALIGGFDPLRFLPKGKVVVLGLVSSIDEAAQVVPVEQLAISTQCGFQGAADRDGAHLTIDRERRKLELVVDVARAVWG